MTSKWQIRVLALFALSMVRGTLGAHAQDVGAEDYPWLDAAIRGDSVQSEKFARSLFDKKEYHEGEVPLYLALAILQRQPADEPPNTNDLNEVIELFVVIPKGKLFLARVRPFRFLSPKRS